MPQVQTPHLRTKEDVINSCKGASKISKDDENIPSQRLFFARQWWKADDEAIAR